MLKKMLLLFSIIVFLISCGDKKFKLEENAIRWNPYKGNEVLIFESNKGEVDTIVLRGSKQEMRQVSPFGRDSFEIITVYSNNYIPNTNCISGDDVFIDICSASPNRDEYSGIGFFLNSKKIKFKVQSHFIKDLDTIKKTKQIIANRSYNDIVIINGKTQDVYRIEDTKNQLIFWSKQEGLLKLVLNDSSSWELIKKYSK